ncbi:proton pump-interactor 1-like protein [Tanacetum coccineum]
MHLSSHMEEQTECDKKGKNIHCFYLVKIGPTHQEVENEEAEKQYQLMNLARLHISEEIDIQRGYAYDINKKLAWYWYSDERIESKMWEIRNLERYLFKVEPSLPILSVPKTNGFYRLPGKSDRSPVRQDRKRCQERLIKKGKIDKEYLQQVQEELLSSNKLKGMTSCGTQELNDLILLDDIEKIKRDQIGRNARVTRLKAELQPVMKNISCLQRELENVNSKRLKAHERVYQLGEQKKEMKSIYDDYQSLMTQVKELVQKGDVVALKQACDTQVQGFIGHWSGSQAFRDDYQKRKLASKA